mmetsp:Transcript_12484/g.52517  ORF Transcript_12484/g.52517 Transcript_12484/m.52517 type:complete len:277 (-) Transcript_12484:68-898(-)
MPSSSSPPSPALELHARLPSSSSRSMPCSSAAPSAARARFFSIDPLSGVVCIASTALAAAPAALAATSLAAAPASTSTRASPPSLAPPTTGVDSTLMVMSPFLPIEPERSLSKTTFGTPISMTSQTSSSTTPPSSSSRAIFMLVPSGVICGFACESLLSSRSSSSASRVAIISSMSRYVSVSAAATSPRLYASHFRSCACRWRAQYRATAAPPWPSYTAKNPVSSAPAAASAPSRSTTAAWASSCVRLHPCIDEKPYANAPLAPSPLSLPRSGLSR